jgi:GT2 family glycosyltransferase
MLLTKPRENWKIAVFLSHYARPDYTEKCIHALNSSQEYPNVDFYVVEDNNPNTGLRNRILDFFDSIKGKDYDVIAKIDNDCLVPKDWLNDILDVFERSDADILSPNVMPSNAAFTYGREDKESKGYRPASIVGGLWVMKYDLIKDMVFERHELYGLTGATTLLRQIVTEQDPKIGWVPDVVVEDMGHWSGMHPNHIKSKEHFDYSKEVGRSVAWSVR